MLVRCEHCGAALPQEASKCFRCGHERTPQIEPTRTEVKIPDPDPAIEQQRQKSIKSANRVVIALLSPFVIGILLGIVGDIMIDKASGDNFLKQINVGHTLLDIGICCCLVSVAIYVLLYLCARRAQKKIIEKNKPEKIDEEEYERRIRDFIGRRR